MKRTATAAAIAAAMTAIAPAVSGQQSTQRVQGMQAGVSAVLVDSSCATGAGTSSGT